MLDVEQFARKRPFLYHLTSADAWPSIRQHGLLSTNEILTRMAATPEQRAQITTLRRKGPYAVDVPELGPVIIRDQKPLSERGLTAALGGCMTNAAWVQLLNERVFFWTAPRHADQLINAREYRKSPGLLLQINTAPFVDAYKEQIELTEFNTGYALRKPRPRSRSSFASISEYPTGPIGGIKELTVLNGVPTLASYVHSVRQWNTDDEPAYLYQSAGV